MFKPVIEMERILFKEHSLYDAIYLLEETKSQAIIDRDGEGLKSVSQEQDDLLRKIEKLELEREEKIDAYRKSIDLGDRNKPVTLNTIVQSMDEDSGHHLMLLGMELKQKLLKLKNLQTTNEKLIRDNLEFYNILISGLKNSSTLKTGYDRDGKNNEKVVSPVLFNKTA